VQSNLGDPLQVGEDRRGFFERAKEGGLFAEAKAIGRAVFPADQEPPLSLHPSEEAPNHPPSLVTA